LTPPADLLTRTTATSIKGTQVQQIKIRSNFRKSERDVQQGDILNVTDDEGSQLVQSGQAEELPV